MKQAKEIEQARLAALATYDILDSKSEEEFDAITRLAAYIAKTPIALITLIDEHRQWFKSKVGFVGKETPRNQAFCRYTIQGDQPFEVPDALQDDRFAQNPLVTGDPHIRYYCGMPLVNQQGFRLGSLCVIDRIPRQLSADQQQALETLAREVITRLELKRQNILIEKQKKLLREINEQLEEKVNQRTQELQEANNGLARTKHELDTFLYRASHDLKGPLCSLEGLIGLAQQELHSNASIATQLHYLDMMKKSTGKLNRVLTNQLIYTQNFHTSLLNEQIDFQGLFNRVLTSCQSLQGFGGVSIETDIQGHVYFCSDSGRLHTVLKNIVENSIIFQNFGIDHPTITIRVDHSDKKATIHIEDNGIGIPPEGISSVFQMFTKYSSQSGGSGLGLFIAKEIIQTLGGTISLKSQPGKGTAVTIEIPNRHPPEQVKLKSVY